MGSKVTFGYLLGDSFAKIGLGMMADNKLSIFGRSGWQGTFSAIYAAAICGIAILSVVAWGEERRLRRAAARYNALPVEDTRT